LTAQHWVSIALLASMGSAVSALFYGARLKRALYPLVFGFLALGAVAGIVAGVGSLLSGDVLSYGLPLGLPWMRWHLRLDPLSGFFLALIGMVTLAVSVYGPGYMREYERGPNSMRVLGLASGLFVLGMQLVVLADDAFLFMIAWELMSVSSYFLVVFQHHHSANRRSAFLYLLMAEIGALMILLAFGVLAAFAGEFTFQAFRQVSLSPVWASVAFTLGLLGFGMKAGIVPVHAWLPEAHPVAPSHISALMSGVMLKVAVYGFVRLLYDLIGTLFWEWGLVLLVIGSITALFGVLYALMQHDLKRLLAYHSIENIGIIYIGLGLSVLFFGSGLNTLGVLGLIAALFHTLNHALFKSLLFLGAGAVLQHTHERDMEHMGGLLKRMPWTGFFFLIGCISISALPPFNGFASEWLTFQTALQATALQSGVLRAVIPVTAAMLALTGALAAACFVKVYGISFLGVARTRKVKHAREASRGMVVAQGGLATLCLLFGVFATPTVGLLSGVVESLTGNTIHAATANGWLWLTPVSSEVASYSAPLVFNGLMMALGGWGLVYLLLYRRRKQKPLQRVIPWGCGFGQLTPRMQYTATAFSMPIRQIFQPVWRLHEKSEREMSSQLPTLPERLSYQLHAEDITWRWLYQPVGHLIQAAARRVGRIQTGQIRHYLVYSFITLLVLLWLIT